MVILDLREDMNRLKAVLESYILVHESRVAKCGIASPL